MVEPDLISDEIESYACSDCGADVLIEDKVCQKCDADFSETDEEYKKSDLAERYCPSCDKPVLNKLNCPHCKSELVRDTRPKWQASILGYLYGALIGGMALVFVVLVEAIFNFSSKSLRMIVFGVVAVGAWNSMKDRLYKVIDDAVIKKVKLVTISDLNNPGIALDKYAFDKNKECFIGNIITLDIDKKNCVIKKDFGKVITKSFEETMIKIETTANDLINQVIPEITICPNCGEELELDDLEKREKIFICPTCKKIVNMNT